MITKGKAVQVIVEGKTISDKRLFTSSGKLKSFLKLIHKYHMPCKISMKEKLLN